MNDIYSIIVKFVIDGLASDLPYEKNTVIKFSKFVNGIIVNRHYAYLRDIVWVYCDMNTKFIFTISEGIKAEIYETGWFDVGIYKGSAINGIVWKSENAMMYDYIDDHSIDYLHYLWHLLWMNSTCKTACIYCVDNDTLLKIELIKDTIRSSI